MKALIASTAARFKEPSSWAGLAGIFAMVGVTVPAPALNGAELIASGICCIVAFFLPEQKPAA